jgi:3-methyl-2-oxobutanoate hydroxymethyltransferase
VGLPFGSLAGSLVMPVPSRRAVIHHCQAVRRGVREALLVAHRPFGAYEASPGQAAASAIRLIKEGGASVVKLEGPSAGLAATITANGIP